MKTSLLPCWCGCALNFHFLMNCEMRYNIRSVFCSTHLSSSAIHLSIMERRYLVSHNKYPGNVSFNLPSLSPLWMSIKHNLSTNIIRQYFVFPSPISHSKPNGSTREEMIKNCSERMFPRGKAAEKSYSILCSTMQSGKDVTAGSRTRARRRVKREEGRKYSANYRNAKWH